VVKHEKSKALLLSGAALSLIAGIVVLSNSSDAVRNSLGLKTEATAGQNNPDSIAGTREAGQDQSGHPHQAQTGNGIQASPFSLGTPVGTLPEADKANANTMNNLATAPPIPEKEEISPQEAARRKRWKILVTSSRLRITPKI